MIIDHSDLGDVYRELVRSTQTPNQLRILIASDCDALCCARIIVRMLESDLRRFECEPVRRITCLEAVRATMHQVWREEIDTILAEHETETEIRDAIRTMPQQSLLLINCGAQWDLHAMFAFHHPEFPELPSPPFRVFVLDSHRPYHLHNVRATNECIVVLNDRNPEAEPEPYPSSEEEESDEMNSDAADDSQDQENRAPPEFDSQGNERPRKRAKKQHKSVLDRVMAEADSDNDNAADNQLSESSSADDSASSDDSEIHAQRVAKRQRAKQRTTRNAALIKRRQIQAKRFRINSYYSKAWWGRPIAGLANEIAMSEHKDTSDNLWLAICGLTHQRIHRMISKQQYENEVLNGLLPVVQKKHPMHNIEVAPDGALQDPNTRQSATPSNGFMAYMPREPPFFLLRHTTIQQSWHNSPFISARLAKLTDERLSRMNSMLTHIGLSNSECSDTYANMNRSNKITLRQHWDLALTARTVGYAALKPDVIQLDACEDTFIRQHSSKLQLTAHDMVYAISALLESYDVPMLQNANASLVESSSSNNNGTGAAASSTANFALNNPADSFAFAADDHAQWKAAFIRAKEALGMTSNAGAQSMTCWDMVRAGLQIAMKHQKLIVTQGCAVMSQHRVHIKPNFRYCLLDESTLLSQGDSSALRHEWVLTRFAIWLTESSDAYLTQTQHQKEARHDRNATDEASRSKLQAALGQSLIDRDKPMLCGCFCRLTNMFTFVSIESSLSTRTHATRPSRFGEAMRIAAEETMTDMTRQVEFAQLQFNTCVVHIAKEQMQIWLDYLQFGQRLNNWIWNSS